MAMAKQTKAMAMITPTVVMDMAMAATTIGLAMMTVLTLAAAAQKIILVKMLPVMIAGASIAIMSHATTTLRDALKSKCHAKNVAAECALNIMKSHAAAMCHNTILKQYAAKSLSTMTLMNAKPASAGFANVSANMFHNTTGNMFAVNKAAQTHALVNQVKGCTVQIILI
jgi:hypothetical protein